MRRTRGVLAASALCGVLLGAGAGAEPVTHTVAAPGPCAEPRGPLQGDPLQPRAFDDPEGVDRAGLGLELRDEPVQEDARGSEAGPRPAGAPAPRAGPRSSGAPGPQAGPVSSGAPGPQAGPVSSGAPGPQAGPVSSGAPGPQAGPVSSGAPGPQAGPVSSGAPGPQAGPVSSGAPGPQPGPVSAGPPATQGAPRPPGADGPQDTPQDGREFAVAGGPQQHFDPRDVAAAPVGGEFEPPVQQGFTRSACDSPDAGCSSVLEPVIVPPITVISEEPPVIIDDIPPFQP